MADARKSLRAIFDEASEMAPGEQRQAYLDQACGGDAPLRANVEELLRAQETAGGFLADPKRDVSAANAQVTEREGDRIGRYKLLQKIGEGGCGIVYMAEQTEPVRRRVALKIIKLGVRVRSVAVARHRTRLIPMTPDGHYAALNCGDGGPQLWNATQLRPVGRPVEIHDISAVSRDGRYLFGFEGLGAHGAWEVSSGRKIWGISSSRHSGITMTMRMTAHPKSERLIVNLGVGVTSELSMWNFTAGTGTDGLNHPSRRFAGWPPHRRVRGRRIPRVGRADRRADHRTASRCACGKPPAVFP